MISLELVFRLWNISLSGDSNHSWCLTKNPVSSDNKLHFSSLQQYGRVESRRSLIWSTLKETLIEIKVFAVHFSLFFNNKILVLQWTHTHEKNTEQKFLAFMILRVERSEIEMIKYFGAKIKLVLIQLWFRRIFWTLFNKIHSHMLTVLGYQPSTNPWHT